MHIMRVVELPQIFEENSRPMTLCEGWVPNGDPGATTNRHVADRTQDQGSKGEHDTLKHALRARLDSTRT